MINEALLKNEELAVFRLRSLYSDFGYTQYKMSKFEEYDLYVRNKDFLISDRVITFTDTNGKLLNCADIAEKSGALLFGFKA